jgi:RimJ/RimL family protein N-acetyltransferase
MELKCRWMFSHSRAVGHPPTEAMKAVVRFVFTQTRADLFLVPPHKDNIPAIRVYEKAAFKKTRGIWYRYHLIFEMSKKDFNPTKRT